MKYSDARPLINDGDHIGILGDDFKARIIAFGQRWAGLPHPTTKHSGIAYWERDILGNNRLMLAQINGTGNNSVYLSQLAGHAFVVSQCPVVFDRLQLDKLLETHYPYHFFGLVQAGVRLFFSRWLTSRRIGSETYNTMFCSMFSARLYQLCGWTTPVPKYICPAELVAATEFKFKVSP